MDDTSFRVVDNKVILHVHSRVCENADELLSSSLFVEMIKRCVRDLEKQESLFMELFEDRAKDDGMLAVLAEAFQVVSKIPIQQSSAAMPAAGFLFRDPPLLSRFVGKMRTRLGITGFEMDGPEAAAYELLRVMRERS